MREMHIVFVRCKVLELSGVVHSSHVNPGAGAALIAHMATDRTPHSYYEYK